MLSDAYGGTFRPMGDESRVITEEVTEDYEGAYANYQKYVDVNANLLMTVLENMKLFKAKWM
jgi:hypothetical protein